MDRLPMCRICLAENVRLCIVANRNLHKLYETLNNIPFITEDSRPVLVCVFCFAKLKQSYRLLQQCLKTDELFTQKMNDKYEPNPVVNEKHFELFGGLFKTPIEQINVADCIAVGEELSAVCEGPDDVIEPKEEHQTDELEPDNLDNTGLDVADKTPLYYKLDLEDDVPLKKCKTEVEDEKLSEKKSRATETMIAEAVPRGGSNTRRGRAVAGSDRSGPSTIEELNVFDINELPVGRLLEVANRKRRWPPAASAPFDPPQVAPQVVVEEIPPPRPQPPQMEDVSPALFSDCESASSMLRPRRSLRDEQIYDQLFYGSEPDSDASDEDDVFPSLIPRAQRSFWETPLDIDDADDQPAAELQPAASSVDANIPYVPPTATDQPWGLYEFDWKPFPNVPIRPESRREMFSNNDVGPTAPCVDPYEIFVSIWDRQFMEYIATETNRYAQQLESRILDEGNLLPNSRIRMWRNTSADELYVYFGVVIAMGVVVKSRIEEYWDSFSDLVCTPGFSAHMSGNRFMMLTKCLHFVNNHDMCEQNLGGSEAKLFKVQPLLSHLNNKFQSLYRLGQNIVLDESLLQWKGGLDISQLIPDKAAGMGIKTYEICESQTGYLWRFEVHAIGKSQRCPSQQYEDPMKASTPAIVLRLTKGLEGKGHTLWMDSFYNSPCLARRLKVLGFDCVGTLRTNRKFVPEALNSLTEENMAKDQITGLTSGDVDVMVWRGNNRVAMISTYHGNAVSRARNLSTKPILINDYNIMMGGVDKKDQMLAMYPIERTQRRVWYKKLFRRLLNVSVLNSFIIHCRSVSSTSAPSTRYTSLSHRNFRICLLKALLSKHSPSIPTLQSATTPSMHQSTVIYDARSHHLAEYPFGAQSKRQRQRRKCTNVDCRKLVHTYCVGCNKAMCLNRCFLILHQ